MLPRMEAIRTTWEYHVERIGKKSEKVEERFNELGRDGWELVSVAAPQTGQLGALSTSALIATFKRPN